MNQVRIHPSAWRLRRAMLPLLATLLVSAPAAAVAPPADDAQADQAAGQRRFEQLCVTCHGPAGDGSPGRAPTLQQRTDLTPAAIRERIVTGKHGEHPMPPWGTVLDDAAIDQLVAYVRWLGAHEGAGAKATLAPFDLDDPARIEAGHKRFNKTCAGYCHGYEGVGGRAPDFKGRTDLSVEDMYHTIYHGREGADVMPPWGGALPDERIWELVAYLRYLGTQAAD
jgi:cbb3-type cytochrome c oxidase subunit III